MKKLFVILATIAFFALPALVPHIVHASGSTTVTLYNPLGSSDEDSDIRIILGRVIKGFLSIIGSIALLMFVYGGTLWLTAPVTLSSLRRAKTLLSGQFSALVSSSAYA